MTMENLGKDIHRLIEEGYYDSAAARSVWWNARKELKKSDPQLVSIQRKYYEAVAKTRADFERDALEHSGFSRHPNRKAIFDNAWERGHSDGLEAVVAILEEYHDLFGRRR